MSIPELGAGTKLLVAAFQIEYTLVWRWILKFAIIKLMKADINQIKQKALPVLKEAGVTRSSLFGSVVRGEAGEDSDIDILVELPMNKSLLDLVRLQKKLAAALGQKVDLVTYNSIHPLLKDYIYKDEMQIL